MRTIADYQFGQGAGLALFPRGDSLRVKRSKSGRISEVRSDEGHLVSFSTAGRFTLGVVGGRRLCEALEPPANRVFIGDESEPYVKDGRNTFAKFVRQVDPRIRPKDEVLVVHHRGELLAVGRAELPATAMNEFETGVAVKVRDGIAN